MAEQRDAREIMRSERWRHELRAQRGDCSCGWDSTVGGARGQWIEWSEHVEDAILAALAAEGWAVARIDPWLITNYADCIAVEARIAGYYEVVLGDDDQPTLRVISPSTREAEQ